MATPPPATDRRMTTAEWSAFCDGYARGIESGHNLAMADVMADLRQASHHLIEAGWIPETVRALDVAQARATRAENPPPGPDFTDPAAVAVYRARIRASWNLPSTRAAADRARTQRPALSYTRTTRGAAA